MSGRIAWRAGRGLRHSAPRATADELQRFLKHHTRGIPALLHEETGRQEVTDELGERTVHLHRQPGPRAVGRRRTVCARLVRSRGTMVHGFSCYVVVDFC